MTAPDHRGKLDALTGLRFLAAFSILVSHTAGWTAPFTASNPVSTIASVVGIYGMPLFFVLSGFVIHYNYARLFRERNWPSAVVEFFIARFARLYPLYFCFLVVGMISDFTVNWLKGYVSDLIKLVATSLTLTQSWVYVIVVNHRLLLANAFGLGWSVSTEWFFYCGYVVLVFGIFRLRTPRAVIAGTAAFSLTAVFLLLFAEQHSGRIVSLTQQYITQDPAVTSSDEGVYRWLFYYSPYVRVLEFILGCLTAQLYMLLANRPAAAMERVLGSIVLWASLAMLAFIGLLACDVVSIGPLAHQAHFLILNYGCAPAIAGVIFCVARYDQVVSRLLSKRFLVQLGEMSYSIYAVHTWTLRGFLRPAVPFDLSTGLEALVRIPVAMTFTIITASATYQLIEVPCRRFLRERLTAMAQGSLRAPAKKAAAAASPG